MGMAKSILLGVAAVLATALLCIIAEVIVFFVSLSPGANGQQPEAQVGIDLVTLAKERMYTPTGLTAAVVIFALSVLLSSRRGIQ